jgi:hypothetical protein
LNGVIERTRVRRVGRYVVRGTSELARVWSGGVLYEVFDNATTTDTSEPDAFERALHWARTN